jgi:hypothetical protein
MCEFCNGLLDLLIHFGLVILTDSAQKLVDMLPVNSCHRMWVSFFCEMLKRLLVASRLAVILLLYSRPTEFHAGLRYVVRPT